MTRHFRGVMSESPESRTIRALLSAAGRRLVRVAWLKSAAGGLVVAPDQVKVAVVRAGRV